MKYKINKTNYRDFDALHIGDLAPRAYAVPFSTSAKASKADFRTERYDSDMVTCLSGEWDFKYYKDCNKMPNTLNTEKTKFDKITVPSTWQRTGYEEPVYLNCPYEFKTFAPLLPEKMSSAIYRKTFDIKDASKTYILSFLGIANNADIYVNGEFVGYREGTHNTTEYDISKNIIEGENELLVVMHKWCNGSFLEAQDMFRENGIFRDVLLFAYDDAYIFDYDIRCEKKRSGYDMTIKFDLCGNIDDIIFECKIKSGKDVVAAAECDAADGEITLKNLDVIEWNAEIPTTYDVVLSLKKGKKEKMALRQIYAFRTIEIKGNIYYFNGKKIKTKGVNHHDTHLTKGYAMGLEDIEKDIKLMKEYNVNTVRTAHYPPDPFLLQCACVYGIYVCDEADIETHGCGELYENDSQLSMDYSFQPRYVDRVNRMYMRDRNNGCIIMWSLGNEAGGYFNQDACYDLIKSYKSDIPVHYEGVIETKRFAYDVSSEMYTSIPNLRKMVKGEHRRRHSFVDGVDLFSTRPFFMCEYAHAMGVGPGNLNEYWEIIYDNDFMMGGCIWEWADHTVLHEVTETSKYKYKYTYGGDHGEPQHDGHFCVDGLFYADRRPHTGARAMKYAYRPVICEKIGNSYAFTNTNRFRNTDYISAKWTLLENGEAVEGGDLSLSIAPEKTAKIKIEHKKIDAKKANHLNIEYFDGEHLLAVEQLVLSEGKIDCDFDVKDAPISVSIDGDNLNITFENGNFAINAANGVISEYVKNGKNIIKPGTKIAPNVTRAAIDNDAALFWKFKRKGLDINEFGLKCDKLDDIEIKKNAVEIEREAEFGFKGHDDIAVEFEYKITIFSNGALKVSGEVKGDNFDLADLVRMGITLELDESFDNVKYFGAGPYENMPDFNSQSPVGIYESTVDGFYEPYVFPQENGMHCDCRYVELTDNEQKLTVKSDNLFAFSVHHFTQENLHKAQHIEDIENSHSTFLTLDAYTRGVGSSSCGPDTLEEYTYQKDELEFEFVII